MKIKSGKDFIARLLFKIKTFSSRSIYQFRQSIAHEYIKGQGIEIGALSNPLGVSKLAQVKYVDRMSVVELRRHYPELGSADFAPVDIIDDGERLQSIPDSSQDFVIANHFIEHCQNPIGAIRNMLRVLKDNGIMYLAIPDKRYSFDIDRPVTSLEHLMRDEREGPSWSRRHHFEEWVRLVDKVQDEDEVKQQVVHLMDIDYSIHYHVWTQTEMLEMILALKRDFKLSFEIQALVQHANETVFILNKTPTLVDGTGVYGL